MRMTTTEWMLLLLFFTSPLASGKSKKTISVFKQLQIYPYKPVYGLPDDECQHPAYRAEFTRCEEDQRKRWHITVDDYVSVSLFIRYQ
ncbi:hypothetical protein BLA29_013817 [Euroglyphus maynei]|uniref:Secreted protein n=1 Tax=Euroglyphus maynei TaxID=6958 RepID=A0A1Y3BMT0_EURMA|nr:hypothetical protein BLA29_013817 [Euroglyphus maynei]